jgi:hypothetical protein
MEPTVLIVEKDQVVYPSKWSFRFKHEIRYITKDVIEIKTNRGTVLMDANDDHLLKTKITVKGSYAGKQETISRSSPKFTPLSKILLGCDLVDHINGCRLDDRRSNLRETTLSLNAKNRKIRKGNTTGISGLSKIGNQYRATWYENGERFQEYFDIKIDAIKTIESARERTGNTNGERKENPTVADIINELLKSNAN